MKTSRTLALAIHFHLMALPLSAQGPTVWTAIVTAGPGARTDHAVAFDSQRGVAVLFGGSGSPADTWEWDGASWTQVATTGPSPRHSHAMAYDAQRGVTVLFGGNDGSGPTGDTWVWNGLTWQPMLFAAGPGPRERHAMAFDSQRGTTVMFGGDSNGTLFGDTWGWDGQSWSSLANSGPSPRSGHAMAYDSHTHRMLLTGGEQPTTQSGSYYSQNLGTWTLVPWNITYPQQLTDSWAWDGASWSLLGQQVSPGRAEHALIQDVQRGIWLMQGGRRNIYAPGATGAPPLYPVFGGIQGSPGSATSQPLGDTLASWDGGQTWESLSAAGPGINGHAAAYNDQAAAAEIYLGNETWTWVGASGAATTFGSGCGAPPLSLAPIPSATPTIGNTAQASVTNTPSALTFVLIGWSNSRFGQFTLPLSLSGYGMPGCALLQSGESGSIPVAFSGPTSATLSIPLPNFPGLIDLHLYLQAYAFASGYNSGNTVSSNGLEWRVGF